MNQYMVLVRGAHKNMEQLSQESLKEHLQTWEKWIAGLGENHVAGDPLQKQGAVILDKGNSISQDPFDQKQNLVGGYLILRANNTEEAVSIAKGCPALAIDCKLEVRPFSDVMETKELS